MKMNHFKKIGLLALLLGIVAVSHAQNRAGGGGGNGGGFGGFGGGGFGGGGFGGGGNRGFGGGGGSTTGGSQYNNNGTVGSASFMVDQDTHSIVVIADQQTAMQISNVIANLDVPKPQVLIKVVFLQVDHNDSESLGIEGSYTGQNGYFSQVTGYVTNYGIISGGSNGVQTVGPTSVSPIHQSYNVGQNFGLASAGNPQGMYQILGSDFTATLRAVAAAGKSEVLSRPSILARDGQLASIVVGQEIYLPSGVSFTEAGTTTVPIINGTYTQVGIILNVTPYIGNGGLVEMILEPQSSAVDTSSPGQLIASSSSFLGSSSTPVYAPNVDITSANTVVVTPNAQTVVIGGLMGTTKSGSVTKVPYLGDIPLLGKLFQTTTKSSDKNELLLFLTPHIIEAPSQLMGVTANGTLSSDVVTNSVSEKQLDRFLDTVPVKKQP